MAMTLSEIITKARKELSVLTGLQVASTVSVKNQDDCCWCVHLEVVERKSIFDSQDILAIYELTIDLEGSLLNFVRIGMRRRADVAAALTAEAGA